jgi:phosphate acetyltransferase
MPHGLYVTATEARSGKSAISLGVMEMLLRKIEKAAFFRPIVGASAASGPPDNDIRLIASRFDLRIPYQDMYGYTMEEANDLISHGKAADVLDGIMTKYGRLKKQFQFVLCEGTDFASSTASFEFDINAEISRNLGCPVLLVANARRKSSHEILRSIELALDSLKEKRCQTIGTILNRLDSKDTDIIRVLNQRGLTHGQLVYGIPELESLGKPTVGEIAEVLGAEVLFGETQLSRHVYNFTVAAMQLRNFLTRVEKGSLIITPGDRADVIIACLASISSTSMENIAGILLTGGLKPEKPIWKLIAGFPQMVPILSVRQNTFPTAAVVDKIHATIRPHDERKITQALAVFEKNVDVNALSEKVITTQTSIVTPKMFEYELLQKARVQKKHIVLPEGEDERILQAAEIIIRRDVADITLIGQRQRILDTVSRLGLQLNHVDITEPLESPVFRDYVETYYGMRKTKGVTIENARDMLSDPNYFGTMMIYKGQADGMISGAMHSTAATIRPAFEFIKTKPGFSIVSSVFFMCLSDRVLVYGDCAVNPKPDARQLAEIALSSALTARDFGIEPIVAMLSYSTGESGKGEEVDRVREATRIAKERSKESFPGLEIDGPIQYDAAVDPSVAKAKMPESVVAGRATVFIFPDLNTGNNTYKAVQRSAGAVAIGPVLQGLRYPVNDLSRGCTVPDIVNTVAITAIQSQSSSPPKPNRAAA